jgi:hypothetical protein
VSRAKGNKQVDLRNGAMDIFLSPEADHAVSVTHPMQFQGTISNGVRAIDVREAAPDGIAAKIERPNPVLRGRNEINLVTKHPNHPRSGNSPSATSTLAPGGNSTTASPEKSRFALWRSYTLCGCSFCRRTLGRFPGYRQNRLTVLHKPA